MWSLVTISWVGSLEVHVADSEAWVIEKVKVWVKSIKSLTKAAKIQPHLACVSAQNEWGYMQRVVANLEKLFAL